MKDIGSVMEHLEIVEMFGIKGLQPSDALSAFIESFPKNFQIEVLDLGCGYGQKSLLLASLGWRVTALDIDADKLDFLKKKAKEHQLNINVLVGSMDYLPLKRQTFDAVLCLSTIHHQTMSGIKKTLSEIHRVLKPGGRVFFDILSINDPSFAIGEEIEPGTKIGGREGEDGIPHHYTTKIELERILVDFSNVAIQETEFSYIYNHERYISVLFEVVAIK